MKRSRQFAPWAVAALALGALLVTATAGTGADGRSQLATRVAARAGDLGVTEPSVRAAKKPGVSLRYFRGPVHTLAPGAADGAHVDCPSGFPHPVSGIFEGDSPQVVLSASVPVGARGWGTSVTNLGSTTQHFFRGVVCVH